ncbi:hypothetical protein ALC60_01833, partial [Trachymyrmex zeteki]
STSECGGSIQSDAHTFARTKNFYSSSIRLKILSRIFRGHSTLNRESLWYDFFLRHTENAIDHESYMIASLSLFRIRERRTNTIVVNCIQSNSLLDIPRPPPPYAALKITGRPCFMQNSIASSELVTGPSVPGTMGTPA